VRFEVSHGGDYGEYCLQVYYAKKSGRIIPPFRRCLRTIFRGEYLDPRKIALEDEIHNLKPSANIITVMFKKYDQMIVSVARMGRNALQILVEKS
jgi:hypothetical protein